MNRGFSRVRPLEGGLDAWGRTGGEYAMYEATLETVAPEPDRIL